MGLVENPPWVTHGASGPEGAEVTLVRQFTASMGARPDWLWGGEQEHMEALVLKLIKAEHASIPTVQILGITYGSAGSCLPCSSTV